MRPACASIRASALAFVLLAAAARGDVTTPAAPAPSVTAKGARGRWRLTHAKVVRDGCGGNIALAAQHVDIGADSLRADVVDRVYRHQGVSERAEERFDGEFSKDGLCDGINLRETWRLDLGSNHGWLSSS